MTSTHKPPKRNTAVLAIIFLLPALYIFAVWINVFQQDITTEQKVTEFTEKFPSFMADYKTIFYISMASCLAALVLAAKSFKQRMVSLRIAMLLTVMIASLIFFVDLFQLF